MKLVTGLLASFLFLALSGQASAKSGCCSWHKGVSHCDSSTGRQVCNDGTYSPSCTCPKVTSVQKHPVDPVPVTSYVGQIRTEILKSKNDYFLNPDGFRESKISDLIALFPNALASTISSNVYNMLPDVVCNVNKFNCPDLITREAGQAVYNKCMNEVGSDIHSLDADNDGEACEANN